MFSDYIKRKIKSFSHVFRVKRESKEYAQRLMEDQNEAYKAERYEGIDLDSKRYQQDKKILRQSGEQDISAI